MGFTRKEAEHLLTLPETMLEKLGLITDKSIIEHYAKGGDVSFDTPFGETRHSSPDFKSSDIGFWRKAEPPEIEIFGVKVRCNPPMSEEPKIGDKFLYIDPSKDDGFTMGDWLQNQCQRNMLKRGLCWSLYEPGSIKKAAQALFKDIKEQKGEL